MRWTGTGAKAPPSMDDAEAPPPELLVQMTASITLERAFGAG